MQATLPAGQESFGDDRPQRFDSGTGRFGQPQGVKVERGLCHAGHGRVVTLGKVLEGTLRGGGQIGILAGQHLPQDFDGPATHLQVTPADRLPQWFDRGRAGRGEAACRRLPLRKLLGRQLIDPPADLCGIGRGSRFVAHSQPGNDHRR
ncbi:MAG: hypothetical protein NTY17_08465 [Planctomycetia bacterium]|nr:hypothetical protein [Planctomycetia bacterium]